MPEIIWVTGANGMLGGAVVAALAEGYPSAHVLTPSRADLDLVDARAVHAFVQKTTPTTVVHVAGLVGGIAANTASPVDFLLQNMYMGMNVLSECRKAGVERVINVSSSCMYPKHHEGLLTEDSVLAGALEPTNEGYALAKIAADRLCSYIASQYGFAYRTIVPSNLYGPGDHFDDHRGHLVANVIRKVHAAVEAGEKTIQIWGDGTARREFTYVGDVAAFVATVIANGEVASLPQRVNVGVGVDYSVQEYYAIVGKVLGYDGTFVHDLTKPTGMKKKLMDSTLAVEHGWRPTTDLASGIGRTYEYFLSTNQASR